MSRRSLVAIVLLTVSLTEADGADYCSDEFKCGEKGHYACGRKEVSQITVKEHGETVTIHTKSIITPVDRGYLLMRVNDFRDYVADALGGANMRQLSWDYELEGFARVMATNALSGVPDASMGTSLSCWVKKVCLSTKNVKEPAVIYHRFSTEEENKSIDDVIKAWTSITPEDFIIKRFTRQKYGILGSSKYAWTALAWGEATKIGCAYFNLKYNQMGLKVDVESFLCVVGPGVNSKDKAVYERGKACSLCPSGTQCNENSKWRKLCSTTGDAVKEEPIPDLGISLHLQSPIPTLLLLSGYLIL